nr:uncharacterized protein CTRU02_12250 [Colletotrichum truncatum]KAF6784789.1 hypothetical protein CTRU02_12250 [Colletotrichum truncatum]
MIIESQAHGLNFEHSPPDRLRDLIENPLKLVFPDSTEPKDHADKTTGASNAARPIKAQPWNFKYSNGVEITMFDLRQSHQHGNLQEVQRRKLQKKSPDLLAVATHNVEINTGFRGLSIRSRRIFDRDVRGSLYGYSDNHLNRTVIHPSVYFLVDCYPTLGIPKALGHIMWDLESFKDYCHCISQNLEEIFDPWRLGFLSSTCCRILICGNTGVGKSTLLNRVFGIEMTQENSDQRGSHNINEAFESDQHPGIIIHDSEGFQTGNSNEVSAFKNFLKARSGNLLNQDNLHVIWLCIDTDTDRPVQSALANVLQEVVEIAPQTPVMIVGTKKDKFILLNQHRQDAATLLSDREAMFRRRFEVEPDTASFWPALRTNFAFVSQDDPESIKTLINLTRGFFSSPEVSEAMCAAQVPDVDAKIEQAVEKTLTFLKATITAAGAGLGTGVISAATTPTISKILCKEIAQGCFGLPEAILDDINTVLARVVWSNLGPFMAQALSQTFVIWGGALCLTCTTVVGGIPLALGAPLLEAPVAARMIFKCACDLILILDQGFRETGKTINRQKIESIAAAYNKSKVSIQKDGTLVLMLRKNVVHERINELVPRISRQAYEAHAKGSLFKYRQGLRDILFRYRLGESQAGHLGLDNDSLIGMSSTAQSATHLSEDENDMKQFKGEDI